jgi:myo-inositol 2-dehydrogenase/D-chiro-inositol 1-dehydrogenase
MEPLRLGFIGAGEMAQWAIYLCLHFAPIKLVAVCDLEPHRAQTAAERFGADRWYEDYQEMLKEAEIEALIFQMHPRPRHQILARRDCRWLSPSGP